MTPMARLRRLWLDVHLWIGAGLLVVLAPLGVTGSILVWHDQLDHALYAERYAVSGPSASQAAAAYAQAAQAAFGARAQLTQVRLPRRAGDPVVAVGRMAGPPGPGGRARTLNAWIDPPTGKVLATAEIAAQATMVIHRLHGSLLIPSAPGDGARYGRQIVGWLGWAMFVSSATGLWLWWPRHGGFVKGLRWRRGASTLFNLHHLMGFWLCVPLAALSLTGVYIAFPQTSHALVGAPAPAKRASVSDAPPLPAPRLAVADAVAAAQAQAPGAKVLEINAPSAGQAPAWRIALGGPGGERTVQVLDATGEVKAGRAPARGGPPGGGERRQDPTSQFMRQLHDGTDMGALWQWIITIAGIAPTLLGITGVVMWLRRSARQRAIRRPAA